MLSSLQHDALLEYMSIAIGQAASLLSDMTGERVVLIIPEIEVFHTKEEKKIDNILSYMKIGHVIRSSIRFTQEIKGEAALFLSPKESKLLAGLFIDDAMIVNNEYDTLNEMDFDAIKEIGNILLNALMGGISNLLAFKLSYEPPEVEYVGPKTLKHLIANYKDAYLLAIHSAFVIKNKDINGTFVVILKMGSANLLLTKINDLVGELL